MSVFKPKKTYIKRYASKNIDKKVKFATNITAEFGSGGKKTTQAPASKQNATAQLKNNKTVQEYSAQIKFADPTVEYRPKYKFTSVEGDEMTVGFSAAKEAAETVQDAPASEGEGFSSDIIEPLANDIFETNEDATDAFDEQSEAEQHAAVALAEKPEEKESDNVTADFAKPKTEKKAKKEEKAQKKAKAKKEKEEKKARAKKEKEENAAKIANAKKEKEEKEAQVKKDKKEKIKKEKQEKKEKLKEKIRPMIKKIVITTEIVVLCGCVGYLAINEYVQRGIELNRELSVVYAPEDYIYPEMSEEVSAKVKAIRDARYNEAMANAYVPKWAEVPNLYKYDYVKTCYLTFDDGPSVEVTGRVLDTLKKYNVPATFFVVGKNAEAYPDLIKRMDAEGHAIGNHSYSHDYGYMYAGDPQFDAEMNACKNAINNILGRNYGNMLYRFPGGSFEVYKQYYIWNIESEGYEYVDWNALTGDSEQQSPDKEYIMNTLKESTNNGTKEDIVVLLHDAGAKTITADTLGDVIEYLKSKNYVFKAVRNSNFTVE